MKVGLLTFPHSPSYGATLQMYALQQAMESLGHTVEAIHYHNAYMRAEKHTIKSKKHPLISQAKVYGRRILHRRMYRKFRRFENTYVHLYPTRAFSDKKRLQHYARRYDAVVCGSDQVWNPRITNGDTSFFLDFCPKGVRRIAYAPSFALETIPKTMEQAVTPLLEQFTALSIRETAGQRLIEAMIGKTVDTVLDPTFLLDSSDWEALERPHPAAVGDYVLYFTVVQSAALYKRCREFAREKGLKLVVVGGNAWRRHKNHDPMVEYAIDIGPQEWLYLVHHARYVVTNSFHGTAFSIIFQKDFYVGYPPSGSSRLEQVMGSLGLLSHVIRDGVPLTDEPISYDQAKPALTAMRERSLRYLETALS